MAAVVLLRTSAGLQAQQAGRVHLAVAKALLCGIPVG
jgi:hypothetical protein